MNTKWKVILVVMLIILSICGVFIALFVFDSRDNLDNFVDTEVKSIQAIVATIEDEISHRYRRRIQTFINYKELPKQEEIVSAFARKDREELLRLSAPFLQAIRDENPYFSTFAWLTLDHHAFLRVHRPSSFGDEIGKMRPDIVAATKDQRQYAGYMVSRTGLQYRIVQPVSYKGQYVGNLQFGLKDDLLLDAIYTKLNVPVGLVIPNKKFSFITHSKVPSLAGSSHTIQSKQIDLFKDPASPIDWNLEQQQVSLEGKTYIIANAFTIRNYRQESQGYVFVALDISKQVNLLQSRIVFILLLSSVLLFLSFLMLYSSYGNLVQKIIDLNKDLQKSNQGLEEQVKERTLSLQRKQDQLQRYMTGIDNIGIGLCVIDSGYRLQEMNDTLTKELGEQKSNRCYRAIMELETPCPNCRLSEVIEQSQIAKYQVTRSDGRIIEIVASPIDNEDGSVSCMEIVRDITDQKEQEAHRLEISKQKEQLKNIESLRTMAGAIAHRFNNAMMVIINNLAFVKLDLSDNSKAHRMISDTAQVATEASQIGSMMLSYVGQQPLKVQTIPLESLVGECVTAFSTLLPPTIALKLTPPDQSLYCSVDQKQIKEVIESILTNASESLEEENGTIEVTFGSNDFTADSFPIPFHNDTLEDGVYVFCQIKDTGHGIKPADLARIFEPFYTTRFVGRGLGLALTVGIMQLHHGAITVDSIAGQGTTVRILLPALSESMESSTIQGNQHEYV